jgi:preprotein translocase subunit YajC
MVQFLAQSSGGSPFAGLLIPVLLLGVFYFLLIRPQQRRSKEQQALIRSIDVGDEIVMTSGIIGTIVDIDEDDDTLTVEIAPDTEIRILRAGVGRRLVADDEEYDEDGETYDEEDDQSAEGAEDDREHQADSDEQQGPIQQL